MAVRFIELDRPQSRPSRRRTSTSVIKSSGRPNRAAKPTLVDQLTGAAPTYHVWVGASGHAYRLAVFSLVGCPEIPQATYILARRSDRGMVTQLEVRRTTEKAASLNLASIRQSGAQLGANEVHVCLAAKTAQQRRDIEADLSSAFAVSH